MDPVRSPELVVQSSKPFNGETPADKIALSFLTPNELFYVRNHLPVPFVDVDQFRLVIETPDGKLHEFAIEDLQKRFPERTVTATIQCAGNRRNEMTAIKSVRGGRWDAGAISNANWTGVYLRDVLESLGFNSPSEEVRHVHFEGFIKVL